MQYLKEPLCAAPNLLLGGNHMKIYDISRPLNTNTAIWEGDPTFEIDTYEKDAYRVSNISLGSHTGTHIDAPYHLVGLNGDVSSLCLVDLIGECLILDFSSYKSSEEVISLDMLMDKLSKHTDFKPRILFKTNESLHGLSMDACKYLVECGIKLIGIDLQTIEIDTDLLPIHHLLLGNQIPILEHLDLDEVPEGIYTLIALPLPIEGADASPCRAVLVV